MKKKLFLTLLAAFGIILSGCNNPSGESISESTTDESVPPISETTTDTEVSDPTISEEETSEEEPSVDLDTLIVPDQLIIHFKNDEENYDNLVFWLWSDGKEPNTEFAPSGEDENGLYIMIPNAKETFGAVHTKVGVILKSKGTWNYQTLDSFIYYSKFTPVNDNGVYTLEVFCSLTARKTLDIVASAAEAAKDKVKNATFKTDLTGVNVTTSGPTKTYSLYAFDSSYYEYNAVDQKKDEIKNQYKVAEGEFTTEDKTQFSFSIDKNAIKICSNYVLETTFFSAPDSKTNFYLSYEEIYNTSMFKNLYYDGDDLGATVNKDSTTFKVWSPVSAEMTLNIYKYGHLSTFEDFTFRPDAYDYPEKTYKMSVDQTTGVWSVTIPGNLHGKYYTYTANNFAGTTEAVDPYAQSAGLNGSRGMVVDWNSEKVQVEAFNELPLKWDGDEKYDIDSILDLVISEVHVRDLTADASWSDNPDHVGLLGTYQGFYTKGTKYTANGTTVKTGFDHLEEYGVNAIQLLPVFDADNNEIAKKYNWGYNPKNFNVVDGIYSTNAKDGSLRIREFRELIAAYANNANNTRIIMDVVYNHTSTAMNSNFQALVPYYYFRTLPDGGLSNGSGCGNEFKTEAPMASKFIVESLCFWAETYKIKGFRFDLMGLIDVNTLKNAKEALYAIDPDIVLYGEGWTGYGSTTLPESQRATTNNVYSQLYHSEESPGAVGGFNDTGRNALRGGNGFGYGDFWGFIAQGEGDLNGNSNRANVAKMLIGGNGSAGLNPIQTINYASCHDNFTLFDQLNYTLSDDGGNTAPDEETVVRASVAANGLILMSNGAAFINGGEEIFRTKIEDAEEPSEGEVMMYGKRISHNSYMSSDFTNSYKYDRKVTYKAYFDMYKNLVGIRKLLKPIYYPDNTVVVDGKINTWDTDSGTRIALYRQGVDGRDYHILFNGRNTTQEVNCAKFNQIFNNSKTNPTWKDYKYTLSQYNLIVVRS